MSATLPSPILRRAEEIRHDLHAHPELRFEEHRTAGVIRGELERLGISWEECTDTGTVGRLAASASGPHVAFRADIDALPVEERTGLPYASRNVGRMHVCGHDGHTASLLATAAWLKQNEAQLPGPVTLIFQPGEEGGHGARAMIEAGVLRGVDSVYGYHSWPAIPRGRVACVDGTVMAANGHFVARAVGRGGHASQPELCIDPILTLSQFVAQLQQVVSRGVAPQSAAVVTVGTFQAGTAHNIIPDSAECTGTVRAPTAPERDAIAQRCETVLRGVCLAAGARADWTWQPDYPATINHAQCAARARAALRRILGEDCLWERDLPIMAAEDFSYYGELVPSCYLLIGSGGEHPCHSSRFDFDDALLPVAVRLWSELAGVSV